MSRRLLFALWLALGAAGCGPDPYTCDDPVETTVSISIDPIQVDPAQPTAPPVIVGRAFFTISCNRPPDTIEIASAAIIEFDTEVKLVDMPLRFAGGAEGIPTCEGLGTSSKVDVISEGLTNADLAPQCNRPNLGLLALIKRSGCAVTDAATRIAKPLLNVQCP